MIGEPGRIGPPGAVGYPGPAGMSVVFMRNLIPALNGNVN